MSILFRILVHCQWLDCSLYFEKKCDCIRYERKHMNEQALQISFLYVLFQYVFLENV